MIQAMVFDLDGTLVQTEKLKAVSYARAAMDLCPRSIREAEILEAFKEVVGLSRREVALALMERFGLEEKARALMAEMGVSTPWQAFVQIRLRHYKSMLSEPNVIRDHQWPHNVGLLQEARKAFYKTGLATMSYCLQVRRVLEILNLADAFDFIASREDVEHGKPDPEIYLLVARELDVPPEKCLVIEDSLTGVKAAGAAGMWCIAVTTPFTRDSVHIGGVLDEKWIVDDPSRLLSVVHRMLMERKAEE